MKIDLTKGRGCFFTKCFTVCGTEISQMKLFTASYFRCLPMYEINLDFISTAKCRAKNEQFRIFAGRDRKMRKHIGTMRPSYTQ